MAQKWWTNAPFFVKGEDWRLIFSVNYGKKNQLWIVSMDLPIPDQPEAASRFLLFLYSRTSGCQTGRACADSPRWTARVDSSFLCYCLSQRKLHLHTSQGEEKKYHQYDMKIQNFSQNCRTETLLVCQCSYGMYYIAIMYSSLRTIKGIWYIIWLWATAPAGLLLMEIKENSHWLQKCLAIPVDMENFFRSLQLGWAKFPTENNNTYFCTRKQRSLDTPGCI